MWLLLKAANFGLQLETISVEGVFCAFGFKPGNAELFLPKAAKHGAIAEVDDCPKQAASTSMHDVVFLSIGIRREAAQPE
jgi:hypothetical protein